MKRFIITDLAGNEQVVEYETMHDLLMGEFEGYNHSYNSLKGFAHVVKQHDNDDEFWVKEVR